MKRINPSDRWKALVVCLFLAGITWLVFGRTLGHEFINLDDPRYVLKNPHVNRGVTINGITWAFTHVYASNWHPVTWISHMLDCQLYGLAPRGHHLTNVILHAATVILLFLVLWQMTVALWRSAFVAAVFAVHPLHVESVAWVSERKDLLSGLFFVLTIGVYTRYARRPWSTARYALVLVLFAIGLMCKPMLVTVPLVLLLLDYWPLNRFAALRDGNGDKLQVVRGLLLEKLPLLALAAAAGAATLFAQTITISPLARISLSMRLANAATSCVAYLRQMFWPADLAVFYPFPFGGLSNSAVALSLLLLMGISAAVFALRRRPYLVTGWLWYLVMLGPVIGIVQVGEQARADRYTYLPQIGLYLAITWAVADLCSHWRKARLFLGPLSAILLAALIITARAQVDYWQNSQSLWRHALASTPDNATARRSLADAFYEKGEMDEALAQYQRSLEIEPAQAQVYANMGGTLLEMGRREQAVAHLERALRLNPKHSGAESNLGLALLELGRIDESVTHLERALEIDSDFADAHYNLGNTFLEMGRASEALSHYDKAVELDPRDTRALNNMAWVLATSRDAQTRDGTKAVQLAERANALTHGGSPVINATLAAAYAEAGRFGEAVKAAQHALQLATEQGNATRADSIRAQIELYQSGHPCHEQR